MSSADSNTPASNANRDHDHDHGKCVAEALASAERVCEAQGARLTPQRRQVLELIWRSHVPVGAYEILDAMRDGGRRADPPTVYRALEFLAGLGLIHRISTRNAFIGCSHPMSEHRAQVLLCDGCGQATEIEIGTIAQGLTDGAADLGFAIADQTVEASGLCRSCQSTAH
ncbi:MAG: transcriptional repressor [Alphaproteobacteria bacterium]|jgi:Fur family transcriptional regulator, zinc uptake regulator|nr:transcriptional repressor [Alphaproteobacteria bacterium]MBT4711402.1 transcriptional repressor [Alphaproteobacteria bacterium]MBT5861242.1 transcriptional repressor [Alphaproteobacteria bacterium]